MQDIINTHIESIATQTLAKVATSESVKEFIQQSRDMNVTDELINRCL